MRKFGLVVLLLMATFGLSASPNTAAAAAPPPLVSDVSTCPAVKLTAPADGAVLDRDYKVRFTWSAEPKGTKTRDWVSIKLDVKKGGKFSVNGGKHAAADRGAYRTFGRGDAGIYTWFVLFKDAKGRVICMSPARTYVVVEAASTAMSYFTSGGAPTVTVALVKGRYVVRLQGSSYAGAFNREVASDNYNDKNDATGQYDWQAQGFTGLDVYGNDNDNTIVGSALGDNLYGLGGNDTIKGKDGDDYIEGGDESCAAGFFRKCGAGDTIEGGKGDDTIKGGNEECGAAVFATCDAGDNIDGGQGKDTIIGGNEKCGVAVFAGCNAGDTINGGNDDDTISGGNEECGAVALAGCNAGDTINGNGGKDTITGGDEQCVGVGGVCHAGDQISGGAGDDTINAGKGADNIHGDGGDDKIDTGGADGDKDTGGGDGGNDTVAPGGTGGDTVTP